MKTFNDVVKWIEKNVPKEEWDQKTAKEAAIWFGCNQAADDIHEIYTARDLASLVQDGMKPYKQRDLTAWLETRHEEDDIAEDFEETNDDIADTLRDHFGL